MPTVKFWPRVRNKTTNFRFLTNGTVSIINNDNYTHIYGPECGRTTNSNPTWRIQIAKMSEAGTPYGASNSEAKIEAASCTSTCVKGPNKGIVEVARVYAIHPSTPGSFPSADQGLSDLALERLKRKLKKRVGGADALVPVAESRELRGLVRQATKMTTELVTTLIDIKRTKGASALKYASSAWLAYGFGIRPLVDDIGNVSKAISNYFGRSRAGIRDAAVAKKTWKSSLPKANMLSLEWGSSCIAHAELHHELSYRWYCGGVAERLASNDYTLAEHLGFSGDNLIPAFWELVPYSWVVDYFFNVGTYLEDVFQVLPGTMYYSGRTKKYKVTINTTLTWVTPADWVASPKNGKSTIVYSEFNRSPTGANLPYTSLRFRALDEVGNFGVTKLLNLASVFIQSKR